MTTVGERIRYTRQLHGLTQDALSRKALISKSFLSEVETGLRNPSSDYLLRIANVLEVSLDYLMRGESSAGPAEAAAGKRVQFPSSLTDFAVRRELPFSVAKAVLEAKLQFVANRRDSGTDNLEDFDWEGFYEAIKDYL